jgi:hypothetical protein
MAQAEVGLNWGEVSCGWIWTTRAGDTRRALGRFLIFPRGVSQGWSRLESCTPGERTESQQVTARS